VRKLIPLLALIAAACQADGQDTAQHIQRLENELLPRVFIQGEPVVTASLAERMEHYGVPAVSIAVFDDGEVVWARAYGMADEEDGRSATPQTLFQAASISKPVAASAMLTFLQDGELDLDENVNERLTSWTVPENDFTAAQAVTLRELVTHTAGMTVSGFPGYARGEPVPTVIEVLDGAGNTDPIRVDELPGSRWRYSGGGYTVMQLLLTDLAGAPFPDIMRQRVLEPAGMTLSTYEQPLPEDRWGEAATGYRSDGNEVTGKWHTYPEMAAAGLWTTPTDLAHWAIAIQRAYDGESDGLLSRATAEQMLEPGPNGWGLGPPIHPSGAFFHHNGANEGFRCRLIAFVEGGRGIAVMTNSDAGDDLYEEIIGTLAAAYDWSELQPEEKVVVEIDPARLPDYLGRYELSFGSIAITLEDGHLWLEPEWSERPEELLPEADDRFFSRSDGAELTFMREGGGVVAFEVFGMRAERAQ